MYKKLTIIFKNNPNSDDEFDGGTYSVDYENASIQITNEHILVNLKKKSESGEEYVMGFVHPIKSIVSYKGI